MLDHKVRLKIGMSENSNYVKDYIKKKFKDFSTYVPNYISLLTKIKI